MRNDNITRLTLAGMFAALAFVCFTYLRIEIPMGGGMTGKIYIGHAFILLSALILGAKYGALTGAIGLSLADILAGYTTSAPPTFLAKFLLGLAVAFIAHKVFNLAAADDKKATKIVTIAAVFVFRMITARTDTAHCKSTDAVSSPNIELLCCFHGGKRCAICYFSSFPV